MNRPFSKYIEYKKSNAAAANKTAIVNSSSSSDENAGASVRLQRTMTLERRKGKHKYVQFNASDRRTQRLPLDIYSSSSEETDLSEQVQVNCSMQLTQKILKASRRNFLEQSQTQNGCLQLTARKKFQPLSISVQQAPRLREETLLPKNILSESTNSPSTSIARRSWNNSRHTFSALKCLQSRFFCSTENANQQISLEDTLIECSQSSSVELNQEQDDTFKLQPEVATNKKFRNTINAKRRCIRGGYFQEFQQVLQKLHMDHRCLAPQAGQANLNLGITGRVVEMLVSFGIHLAKVQPNKHSAEIFCVIIGSEMAHSIGVGSKLQLFSDLEPLKLPNNELVYLQPHKIFLI